jgi:hypothetical protein
MICHANELARAAIVIALALWPAIAAADHMALRAGEEDDAADREPPITLAPAGPTPAAGGNNAEALATARSLVTYLRAYLPPGLAAPGLRVHLRLVADEDSEQSADQDADETGYRQAVRIAYLVVYIPARSWKAVPLAKRRWATTLAFPLLRSLYPGAGIYLTVFDGATPVANANWRTGARSPMAEVE